MNLPEDYQNKMQKMLGGDEYLQYLDSFNYSYGQTLRVNQLKKEPADFIRRFLLDGQVSWCSTGFYYEGEQKLSAHPYYYAGVYYLQEPSAMAPAAFLPVEPGDKVLDPNTFTRKVPSIPLFFISEVLNPCPENPVVDKTSTVDTTSELFR